MPDGFGTPIADAGASARAAGRPPPAPLVRVGGDVREPKKISDVRPIYPAFAQAAKVEGMVILEAVINERGVVERVKVLRVRAASRRGRRRSGPEVAVYSDTAEWHAGVGAHDDHGQLHAARLMMLLPVLAILATLQASRPRRKASIRRFVRPSSVSTRHRKRRMSKGYLALWSKTAQRPRPEQLKYIFDAGDDKFSDLAITRVTETGDRVAVRVSVTRDRTNTGARRPDGSPIVSHAVTVASLTYVREGTELKLVREGSVADGLAEALIGASTIEERARLLEAEPELVDVPLVLSLARTADVWIQGLQYSRALPIYELTRDVAHRIGNARLEGEALQNIGNARYFLRNFDDALAAYQQRLEIEREAANESGIASALLGIATVKYSTFEYTEALAAYREALPIQERLKEETGLATTLISTGNVQYVQADYAGAIADYRRSRDLYRQVGDTNGEARALEGLGRSLAAQGNFGAALESYAGVLSEGRARRNPQMQGTALLSIGEIHLRLGNLDMARPLFEESRTHFELHEGPAQRRPCVAGGGVDRAHVRAVPRGRAGLRQEQRGLRRGQGSRMRRPRRRRPGVRAVVAGALRRGDRDVPEGDRRVHGAAHARGRRARGGRTVARAARQQGCGRRARGRGPRPSAGARDRRRRCGLARMRRRSARPAFKCRGRRKRCRRPGTASRRSSASRIIRWTSQASSSRPTPSRPTPCSRFFRRKRAMRPAHLPRSSGGARTPSGSRSPRTSATSHAG